MTTEVIVRKKKVELSDAEKYSILRKYSEGIPVTTIAAEVQRSSDEIGRFIQTTLREMTAIRETNIIKSCTTSKDIQRASGKTPSKFITTSFLKLIDTHAEVYAYYYARTGDNKFSLIQSGLDVGMPKNMRLNTKDYIYRIRGQYLRDIPLVRTIIQEEQDRRIQEYQLEKPQVQMELVQQVEELKEVVVNDPRQRSNLLKAIEMLGRSIGAFTDNVKVEEVDAKSGLEILMERAREEANTYERKKDKAAAPTGSTDILPH